MTEIDPWLDELRPESLTSTMRPIHSYTSTVIARDKRVAAHGGKASVLGPLITVTDDDGQIHD